jgi:hypothetical protein
MEAILTVIEKDSAKVLVMETRDLCFKEDF